jgi:hypothetical protein
MRTTEIKPRVQPAGGHNISQLALAVGAFCGFLIVCAAVVGLLTGDWVAVRWTALALVTLGPVGYWHHRSAGSHPPDKRRPGSWY